MPIEVEHQKKPHSIDLFNPRNIGIPICIGVAVALAMCDRASAEESLAEKVIKNVDQCSEMGLVTHIDESRNYGTKLPQRNFVSFIGYASVVKLKEANKNGIIRAFDLVLKAFKPMEITVNYETAQPGLGFMQSRILLDTGTTGALQAYMTDKLGEGNHPFTTRLDFNGMPCMILRHNIIGDR